MLLTVIAVLPRSPGGVEVSRSLCSATRPISDRRNNQLTVDIISQVQLAQ